MPAAENHKTFGFIGLGLMGLPMCRNIAVKMSPNERILAFDIAQAPMEELAREYPGKVTACSSPAIPARVQNSD
ncbi:hypothetical protein V2G26_012723 [Clonostachys chloroleuca]|uniref:6-phosphogluconate dehydrogenase NADP-binding domain-containing protein n=1 Tax=Clonostachys chloroleuca TaxID=1926264 RepID=A0AA35M7S3_9HYPO|nr:unnamed protein product [Clonostachys chloroleuca]